MQFIFARGTDLGFPQASKTKDKFQKNAQVLESYTVKNHLNYEQKCAIFEFYNICNYKEKSMP